MTRALRALVPALTLALLGCGGSGSASSDTPPVDALVWDAPDAPADSGGDAHVTDPAEPDASRPDEGPADARDAVDDDPDARAEPAADAAEPEPSRDVVAPDAADGPPPEVTEPFDAATPDAAAPDVSADPGVDTSGPPAPLFDHAAIRDASTAACTFTNKRTAIKNGAILDVWDVSYLSWEAVDGALQPITIRGFLAKPLNGSNLAGVIQAHGLGGCAEQDHATGPAALLDMAVLAYTGPGGGLGPDGAVAGGCAVSEGKAAGADSGYHLFDVLPDPRGTWFWGHPVAAMRGITCLQQRPDVDPNRIGMTGFSAGGVATLVVAGADDRVKAGVPLSACGRWDLAVQSPNAWQIGLLQVAGLTTSSPEWSALLAALDPAVVVAGSHAPVMMVNGTSDEFFPLTAHVPTLAAITQAETRTSLVGNFDHGCYQLTGGESAATIEERATLRAEGAQRLWLRHWLTADPTWAYVPAAPVVSVQPQGGGLFVTAVVDGGGSALTVENVKLWWSLDDAFLWGSNDLQQGTDLFAGVWWALLPVAPAPNLVTFVDVQYKTTGFPTRRFSISSVPALPAGLVPHIRGQANCL